MTVLDYSTARPDPAAMRASGAVGVMRYLSLVGNPKNLTGSELAALLAAGLEVGLVWETSANRTSAGSVAGHVDAIQADQMATALGFPADRPVYFATDGNVYSPTILSYYQAAIAATSRPVGVYGSTTLLDACAGIGVRYGWKVSTWGGPTNNACLQQMANTRPTIPGTDVNEVLHPDWGQLGYQEDDLTDDQAKQLTEVHGWLSALLKGYNPEKGAPASFAGLPEMMQEILAKPEATGTAAGGTINLSGTLTP